MAVELCINWTRGKHSFGYGVLTIDHKSVLAHRVSYCDSRGIRLEDIAHLVVRHKCDNPSCFNPDHLELGTQADNIRDMVERGRNVDKPETTSKKRFAQRKRFDEQPVSDETRRRSSEAHIGKKQSLETKDKIASANRRRVITPEMRQNMIRAWEVRRAAKGESNGN